MKGESAEVQLLQLRNLTMKLGRMATPAVVALLCETVWGTPGRIRYQHFDTREKIQHLHDPWFLYLEKGAEVLGALCLDHRPIQGVEAFYIRYFSFAEGFRRKNMAISEEGSPASRGKGVFKRFSTTFFENPLHLLEAAQTPRAVFYAFVELENARSHAMVKQMGLTQCGQFSTLLFSRMFPKRCPRVRRYRMAEREHLRAAVASAYAGHAFYTDHGLFYKDNFFVLEIDGCIVAGLQAHVVHWKVVEIPGVSGKLMTHILPWIPLLSRLFNPQRFHFAAIEGLFWLPGHENQIQSLLESVLAELGLYSALCWLSTDSPHYRTVRRHVRMGILEWFKKDLPAAVVMRAYGLSERESETLTGKPVYISSFDAT